MSMDLGTISGTIGLDTADFDRKYASVDGLLDKLEARKGAEVHVGADVAQAESDLSGIETFVSGVLDGMSAEVNVSADTAKAEAATEFVEGVLEGLARREYDPKVDVDITRSSTRIEDIKRELEVLGRMEQTPKVTADTTKAQKELKSAEARLKALEGLRSEMVVVADVSPAEEEIASLGDEGERAGDSAGMGMAAGILAGLASIPIAGAVIKVGQAIAGGLLDGIQDGLQQEATRDLFSARTGLDEGTASKFAAAAGEAYANAFGQSIEGNLDIARTALQLGIIDSTATDAEIQKIIAKIDTLSLLAEEDARRVATAVDVMVSNGIVKSADEAFDVLTRGFQSGVDSGEDLLDTFIEYPALLERLGLDAETAMGLLNQGLEAGARNSDFVADALKEFQIRATDASEASAKGFERIGLNAEEMTAKIAKGGPDAREGLDQVLDGLRAMEDPVERNAAGVELFGTKWEDLGDSILALDVSTAVSSLGQVEGALDEAMTALADNPATAVESAKRNIEVAAAGIKGSLATMFAEPLEELAAYVSTNRAGVLEYAGTVGNALFDMAEAGVEASAMLIESIGKIPGAFIPVLDYLAQTAVSYNVLAEVIPNMPSIPMSALESIGTMREGISGVEEASRDTADALRDDLIGRGLDPLQEKFNEGLDVEIMKAQVHDAATALQADISGIGEAMEDISDIQVFEDGSFKTASEDAQLLDEQLRTAVGSIAEVQSAAQAAGESQAELSERWHAGRDALVAQLEAMGFNTAAAEAMATAYGAVPEQIETSATLDAAPAKTTLGDLVVEIDAATGTVTVNGDKTPADTTLGELVGNVNASDGTVKILGNKVPASITLEQLLGAIGSSSDTVTINGQDYPARSELGQLLATVRASSANINVGANTYSATSALDNMIRTYNGRTMTVYTMMKTIGQAPVATGGDVDAHAAAAMGATATRLAGGGSVIGPGSGTSDDVPAAHPSGVQFWLSNGEHVLTADDVLDLGGQQGAYALRSMIQAGMIKPLERDIELAGGGTVNGPAYTMPAPSYSPAPAQSAGPVSLSPAAEAALLAQADRPIVVAVNLDGRELGRSTGTRVNGLTTVGRS